MGGARFNSRLEVGRVVRGFRGASLGRSERSRERRPLLLVLLLLLILLLLLLQLLLLQLVQMLLRLLLLGLASLSKVARKAGLALFRPIRNLCPPVLRQPQGYLAPKNQRPLRTLPSEYAYGPMVVLGRWAFLMSEVPLQFIDTGMARSTRIREWSNEHTMFWGSCTVSQKQRETIGFSIVGMRTCCSWVARASRADLTCSIPALAASSSCSIA